jgi:hypothetical protein
VSEREEEREGERGREGDRDRRVKEIKTHAHLSNPR